MPWIKVVPVVDPSVRGLCVRPYGYNKKGCPNFHRRSSCPPEAPMIYETLDLTKDIYAIYNIYDIATHVKKMKDKHPKWSERQLYCVLYWQGTARKQLKDKIKSFMKDHRGFKIISCPEAQGVNLTETMANVGIKLDWPPKKIAYQIVLAGISKKVE